MTRLNEKSKMIGNLEISLWFEGEDGFWHSSIREWDEDKWIVRSSIQSVKKKLVEEMYNQAIQSAEISVRKKEVIINHEEVV